MAKKPNPLLDAFEKKIRAEERAKLDKLTEINIIAHLISGNEYYGIGPGRAGDYVDRFLEMQMEIASSIIEESDGDEQGEFIKTKHDMAKRVKQICGPETWEHLKPLLPMFHEVWDLV